MRRPCHARANPAHRRFVRDRRGSAMVEAALVLPLVIVLLFGLVEMGRALHHHHVLNKSVRDAARYLARVPLDCPATGDASWGTVTAAAKNLALTGQIAGGTPLVSYWAAGDFTVANPTCTTWSGRQVQIITVNGQVTYDDLGFLGLIGLGTIQLAASHEQVHIGE